MSAAVMEVLRPGMFSTFQDLGRTGWQHLGVPVSGAMDEVSHRVANLLVGNDEHEATLEMTVSGAALRFECAATVAIAGADLCAELHCCDGSTQDVACNEAVSLGAGDVLQFGRRLFGVRAYLAVQGGFGLTAVMGSCSTYVRGAMGGHQGRALRKGDRIELRRARSDSDLAMLDGPARQALASLASDIDPAPIRALRGREWRMFAPSAQADFFRLAMTVSAHSERMGYRMTGVALARGAGSTADIASEAVAFGTVQVPMDGMPIVLMADRQSSGGYPRIAQVASVDLPRLAQVMPGESIRFEEIDQEEAYALLAERGRRLASLRQSLAAARR